MQVLRGTYDLVCFADCQGKQNCPDKRVYERMPAVMRLVRGTTALQPNANSQQMDGKSVDSKRGHAMMQCNRQLGCFFLYRCVNAGISFKIFNIIFEAPVISTEQVKRHL